MTTSQNLGDYEMRSEHELFGLDHEGRPRVTLKNEADRPREDIVLPVCYRNTPWALATAHALGFGLYRPQGIIQMFEEPSIWPRIGYEVVAGRLELGAPVTVQRSPGSYPSYFVEWLSPQDAIQCAVFNSAEQQYSALAESIKTNLEEDELEPTDVLVILPSAYTSKKTGAAVMAALSKIDIPAHLAGVTTSRDEIFQPNSVAVTHIFRAKGNEAPMVYFINAEFCQTGFELSRKRNILFTGITRSKCWIRLFGVGEQMRALCAEVDQVRAHHFQLAFHYPDRDQIQRLAKVHRDMTDEERKDWENKISMMEDVIGAFVDGDLPLEALPKRVRDKLGVLSRRGHRETK